MMLNGFMGIIDGLPKGANIVLEWNRPAKTLKAVTNEIRKAVRMVGRVGIDYNNIEAVKAKRASGELPDEAQPLWNGAGEWVVFPFILRHKVKGTHYARFYYGTSATVSPKVQWYMDGNAVSYEVVEPLLRSEEKRDEKQGDCFTVCVDHVLRVGSETSYSEEYPSVEGLTSQVAQPVPVESPVR